MSDIHDVSDTGRQLAVVTGASSGIGLALAHEFAKHDFDLVLAAEDHEVARVATDLSAKTGYVVPVQTDLATFEGVERLAAAIEDTGRPVAAAAINAGVGVGGAFVEGRLEDHLRLVELNVTSSVHLAGRLLPAMVAKGEGRLLFTSSIAAVMPGPYTSTYNASKAFLLSFAEAIRVELEDAGVSVTTLMPGPTATNFFERAGIEDTKLGQSKKDDPADVARQGYEAMMAGKDHVVAGSMKNKAAVAASKVMPAAATAKVHAVLGKPGSGGH